MASRHSPSLETWFSAATNHDYATINELVGTMARSVDKNKETALMKAVRVQDSQMVGSLVKYEAGEVNDKGHTALMIAAINNFGSLCTILAPCESNIHLSDGRTALMLAASVSACSSIKALIPFQHGRRDANGMTALMYAVIYGNIHAASTLVNYEKCILSSENKSALIIAAEHYRKDMIQLLYPHECGLLPDSENIALAPYKSLIYNMKYTFSHLDSSDSSDIEYKSQSQHRSKSISSCRESRPSSLDKIAKETQKTSAYLLLDNCKHNSSLDLSWNESHAPHKIHSVRVNFSPRKDGKSSHFNSLYSQQQQQRSRSAGIPERSNCDTISIRQYFNTLRNKNHSLLQDSSRKKTSPRSLIKILSRLNQRVITKSQHITSQKPMKSRRSSEEYCDYPASNNTLRCTPYNTASCQSHISRPSTSLQKRTICTFTPTPTPEPNRTDNRLIHALKRHILSLEHELSQKDRELQMIIGFDESSHKRILVPHNQNTNKKSPYEITFTQSATQTEAPETCEKLHSIQNHGSSLATHSDTMKKLQTNAYLKQLCASLALVKEDILLLCNTARHECEQASHGHLAPELSKNYGSLDNELEDDTFVVFVPCNHLIDLTYFVMKNGGEERTSITECPRCGVQPTSIITVRV